MHIALLIFNIFL